jgi:hypothetical protein
MATAEATEEFRVVAEGKTIGTISHHRNRESDTADTSGTNPSRGA